jgi:hypothetical protein
LKIYYLYIAKGSKTPMIRITDNIYNRKYNWNYTPLLVVYNNFILSSSMTYQQNRNKTNITRRVPPLEQKLLTQLEQSFSKCWNYIFMLNRNITRFSGFIVSNSVPMLLTFLQYKIVHYYLWTCSCTLIRQSSWLLTYVKDGEIKH